MPGLRLGKEAQAKFDEAKANPDHKGFLEKRGARRKQWNKRFFVLKDNYLFYCKTDEPNVAPQGIINLHGATVNKTADNKPYCFSLLVPKSVSVDAKWSNRTYTIAAPSEAAMDDWMRIITEISSKPVRKDE